MVETLKRDKKDDEHLLTCLPQEVILENILTRLPVKTLIKIGSVCKLWYNSVHHDPRFASSQFLHSQNNPYLMFSVFNAKDNNHNDENSVLDYYFFLSESKLEVHSRKSYRNKEELVGYCNGFICRLRLMSRRPVIQIYHPSRREKLYIIHPIIKGDIICYGFGFDSLSNEYKVVIIFFEHNEFNCKVYTLGTNSWREITCHPSTNQVLKNKRSTSTNSKIAAIFCDGVLFWRTTRQPKHNLLSFHLHDETFQVIRLPTECVSMPPMTTKKLHLMELNGSLCAARLEKILPNDENNSICCKVHLHILKDCVIHVWIKETLLSSDLSRPCLYNTNTTRIMSFSGRVMLYWFNGKYIQFYDLHMKYLNVVDPFLQDDQIFERKKLSTAKLSEMDYRLYTHIENFISLQTFLPKGDHRNDIIEVDGWRDMLNHGAGLLYRCRNSRLYCKLN